MTTPPANARDEQRARTRQELLDAAARVFAERGFHGASVDLVADAAGYTKGAVYSNFASKEELFLDLLDQHAEQLMTQIEQTLLSTPADERAQAFTGDQPAIDLRDTDWYLLETEFLLYAARNETARERVAQCQQRVHDRTTAIMRQHLDEIGAGDAALEPGDYARVVTALTGGLLRAALAEPPIADDIGRLLTLVGSALLRDAAAPE